MAGEAVCTEAQGASSVRLDPGPVSGLLPCLVLRLTCSGGSRRSGWVAFSLLFNQSLCDVPAPMLGMGDLETNQICGPWMLQMVLAKASSLYP